MKLDFLLNLISSAIASAGESKLEDVLNDLAVSDVVTYKAAIHGGHAFVKALTPVVGKTKTDIDNAFLEAIDEAVNKSAAKNGIVL